MKLSKLIEKLQNIQKNEGDLDIWNEYEGKEVFIQTWGYKEFNNRHLII